MMEDTKRPFPGQKAYTHLLGLVFVVSCLLFAPFGLAAQEKFTDHLTRQEEGQGKVTITQDPEIERLVNGARANAPASPAPGARPRQTPVRAAADSTAQDSLLQGSPFAARRIRANGYRIQVYAGGNNRKSKTEAYHVAGLVRTYFSDVAVYTHFVSPRWICRVGDFRTIEEAHELLSRMRQTGQFPEASIVKTKILIYY